MSEMNNLISPSQSSDSISKFELKYSKELGMCRTIDEFYNHIGQCLRFMGFSEYSFSRLSATPDIFFPLFTMPLEMNHIYFTEEYYESDPMIQYLLWNDKPIFLSDIKKQIEGISYETEELQCNKKLFTLLDSYGYTDFYYIPIGDSRENSKVTLAVATKSPDIKEFHTFIDRMKPQLMALTEAINFVGAKKYSDIFGPAISAEEPIDLDAFELFEIMVRKDLKLIDAAKEMNISRHAANRKIKYIKDTLKVKTALKAFSVADKRELIMWRKGADFE